MPEIYDDEHKEQIIKVILQEAIEHLMKSNRLLESILEALSGEIINYLQIESDFFNAANHITQCYMKVGYPASLADFFEPAIGHVNTASLYWEGCFHEWKSASGRGTTKPPGLTQHAVLCINQEINEAQYLINQLNDLIFDKMTGLTEALKEVDSIRILRG